MKAKSIVLAAIVLAIGAGVALLESGRLSSPGPVESGGRKVSYYTCSMHPWVRESKPGPCPVCGMNLTPVYASDAGTTNAVSNSAPSSASNEITLEPESISVINVQTDSVARRPVRRVLHFSGQITGNSWQSAWFEFIVYQRDLEWLKMDQTFDVFVTGVPDKTFTAQFKLHGVKPFANTDFDMMSGSTTMRAEISNAPVIVGDLGKGKFFNGLHAEAHVIAGTEPTLTIPRSAIISRGTGAMVYVDNGKGRYTPRTVELGRIGDEFAEVTAGLKEGERVVTTGNLLIDSEAQLTTGE